MRFEEQYDLVLLCDSYVGVGHIHNVIFQNRDQNILVVIFFNKDLADYFLENVVCLVKNCKLFFIKPIVGGKDNCAEIRSIIKYRRDWSVVLRYFSKIAIAKVYFFTRSYNAYTRSVLSFLKGTGAKFFFVETECFPKSINGTIFSSTAIFKRFIFYLLVYRVRVSFVVTDHSLIEYLDSKFIRELGVVREQVNRQRFVLEHYVPDLKNIKVVFFEQPLVERHRVKVETYRTELHAIFEVISTYYEDDQILVKHHPGGFTSRIPLSNSLTESLRNCPSEVLSFSRETIFITVSSTSVTDLDSKNIISVMNLITYKSSSEKNYLHEYFISRLNQGVFFPKTLGEFAARLEKYGPT